ncbi:hypothetical protein E2C01_018358 [Portunus trituberculatus]|uniref:Uncharacterized protein n=1 Tax=Portunus trituberculatus TaxID=210409 RepID=A0A5B7DW66_PORTR|nr:hypothetical protein [Portunus trituberculatus]
MWWQSLGSCQSSIVIPYTGVHAYIVCSLAVQVTSGSRAGVEGSGQGVVAEVYEQGLMGVW